MNDKVPLSASAEENERSATSVSVDSLLESSAALVPDESST